MLIDDKDLGTLTFHTSLTMWSGSVVPKALMSWPKIRVMSGWVTPLATAVIVPMAIKATSVLSANEKSLKNDTFWFSPPFFSIFSSLSSSFFMVSSAKKSRLYRKSGNVHRIYKERAREQNQEKEKKRSPLYKVFIA